MINDMGKFANFVQQTQALWAVLLGMFVQFWFGDRRGGRVALTIVMSSVFVALYFVPALIDILNAMTVKMFSFKISSDSNIAIMFYASSSLISIEIMAIVIKILPEAVEQKVSKFLGVEDDTDNKV